MNWVIDDGLCWVLGFGYGHGSNTKTRVRELYKSCQATVRSQWKPWWYDDNVLESSKNELGISAMEGAQPCQSEYRSAVWRMNLMMYYREILFTLHRNFQPHTFYKSIIGQKFCWSGNFNVTSRTIVCNFFQNSETLLVQFVRLVQDW